MLAACLPASQIAADAQPWTIDDPEGVLRLKRSSNFGISDSGQWWGNGSSLYSIDTEHRSALTFDVSNNQIAASFTQTGLLQRACIATGLQPLPVTKIKGGVYSTKRLLYGGPWEMQYIIDGDHKRNEATSVVLVENLLPMFVYRWKGLTIYHLVFAPFDVTDPKISPRVLLHMYIVKNDDSVSRRVHFVESTNESATGSSEGSEEATSGQANDIPEKDHSTGFVRSVALCIQGPAIPVLGADSIDVPPLASRSIAHAWSLAEGESASQAILAQLAKKSVRQWLDDTLLSRLRAFGALEIVDDSFVAESLVRQVELARQTALRLANGEVCGGFLGSDVDRNQVNWVRDSYYSMLSMSLFDPLLCRDSIPYLLKWGVSPAITGPGRFRFPGRGR